MWEQYDLDVAVYQSLIVLAFSLLTYLRNCIDFSLWVILSTFLNKIELLSLNLLQWLVAFMQESYRRSIWLRYMGGYELDIKLLIPYWIK